MEVDIIPYKNELDYVEIATIGNALDFGDLSDSEYAPVGFSNGTRAICRRGSSLITQ